MFDSLIEKNVSVMRPNESTFRPKKPDNKYWEVLIVTKAELIEQLKSHTHTPEQIHKFGPDEYAVEFYKEKEDGK